MGVVAVTPSKRCLLGGSWRRTTGPLPDVSPPVDLVVVGGPAASKTAMQGQKVDLEVEERGVGLCERAPLVSMVGGGRGRKDEREWRRETLSLLFLLSSSLGKRLVLMMFVALVGAVVVLAIAYWRYEVARYEALC